MKPPQAVFLFSSCAQGGILDIAVQGDTVLEECKGICMMRKLLSSVRILLGRKHAPDRPADPVHAPFLAQDIEDRAELFSNCGYDDHRSAMLFLSTGTPEHIVTKIYGETTCKRAIEEFYGKPQ